MSLNLANVDKLLATLRCAPAEKFNMRSVFQNANGESGTRYLPQNGCGTAACIAGWCAWIGAPLSENGGFGSSRGGKWLGIDQSQAWSLFCPAGFMYYPGRFPLARAIDVVQHLRDTGEVDWLRFPAENYRQPPVAPKPAWTPPVVISVEPELPESLTSLLRQPVEAIDAG